jgi:polyisoprenoid-binding protein YceI
VTFAIAPVSTTSDHLNGVLQTADFFDTSNFPEARFISTKVVANSSEATVDGNLTIKGITKPATLQVRFVGAGTNPRPPNKATIGFAASAVIKRSDFGISFGLATRTGCPRSGKRSSESNEGQKATAIKGKTAKRPCLTLG